MDRALSTGSIIDRRAELGAFYTPPELVSRVIELAHIERHMRVLEPSAGTGALAIAAREEGGLVDVIEIDRNVVEAHLFMKRFGFVTCTDFLKFDPVPVYDRVIMNPPFAKRADIRHVTHARKFMRTHSRLVAIMSAGIMFRDDAFTRGFRESVIASGGEIEALPEGSFKASGTAVNTCIITIERGAE